MFLIPWKRGLEQLSRISSDLLGLGSSVNHVHLTKFRVGKENGDAEFIINELNFSISGQWLVSFEEYVFLWLTVFCNFIYLFFKFGFLLLLDFGLFLDLRFGLGPQLIKFRFLSISE